MSSGTPSRNETIFLSEDLAGVGVQGGWKSLAYRAYARVVSFFSRTAILFYRPEVIVTPAALGHLGISQAGIFTNTYVISKSFAHADLDPLLGLKRSFLETYREESGSTARTESLSNHILLAGLLEHIARPAEAFSRFFVEQKMAGSLLLLSGISQQERLAALVAKHRGLRVSQTFWRVLGAPVLGLRHFLSSLRDGLPSLEQMVAHYSSGGSATPLGGVVFFCVEERRIRRLQRTMGAIAASGVPTALCVLSTKKQVRKALEEIPAGVLEVASVNQFLPAPLSLQQARAIHDSAKAAWLAAMRSETLLRHHYQGVPLAAWAVDLMTSPWAKKSVEAAMFERAANNYLDQRKPRLVLITDDGLHSNVLARLCREREIPTSTYVYNPVLFTVSYWKKLLFETNRSTFAFTATDYMADAYRKEGGFAADRVRVVGDVFGEEIRHEEKQNAQRIMAARLALKEEEKVVLALSSFVSQDISESQKRQFFRCAWAGVREIPDVRLVVKAHPNEDLSLLRRLLEEEGIEASFVAQNESLKELLLASDAACMMFSQAGMEAVMCRTPLFIIQEKTQLEGFEDWMPYVREGAADFVSDDSSFARSLAPILRDPGAREKRLEAADRFCEKYITPLSIDPVAKMTEEVRSILAELGVSS